MLSKSVLVLLCVGVGMPLVARADAVPDATQQVIAGDYKTVCAAYLDPSDANLNAGFALLAPDYVDTDLKGKQMKRDELVAQAKQQIKQLHVTSCDSTIDSQTATDANTVVVAATLKFAGQLQAPDGSHDLDATAKSTDTWKLVNGTWLETQSQETRNLIKIDGKVVQDEGQ